MADDLRAILLMIGSGALVALVAGALAYFARLRLRRRNQPVFSPIRRWYVPWHGWTVVLVFVGFQAVPMVVGPILGDGFFRSIYGPDFPPLRPNSRLATEQLASATLVVGGAGDAATSLQQSAATVRQLWILAISFFFIVPVIWLPLRAAYGPRDPRPGVQVKRDFVLAYLVWLILTPIVFAVFAGTILLWRFLTGGEPSPHPLTQLGPFAGPLERALLILEATIFAAILEESLFRGALLPWLLQRPRNRVERITANPPHYRRSDVVAFAAVAFALLIHANDLKQSLSARNWDQVGEHAAPGLFILALVPLFYLVPRWSWLGRKVRLRSARMARSVWASAMLFAAFHSKVWPSPVPLFVLGLGLGWLVVRTRGVLAPIIAHGLFNAISVTYLLLGGET